MRASNYTGDRTILLHVSKVVDIIFLRVDKVHEV